MSTKYTIKDLERVSGIKAHTLRIWEQRYDILIPKRTITNIRYYNDADLKKVLNVSLLNNNGFKISSIAKLNHESLVVEVEKLFNDYKKESLQIESLVICMLNLDEARFEKIINNSILHFGFENTIEKILFPFIQHMGNMWQTGIINPAQEHYISNLIRQKLIARIDNLSLANPDKHKTYLFYLPSQELHEMSLLYACFLCKARGNKCLYLGQSVPHEDLDSIVNLINPDVIVSIITSSLTGSSLNDYLNSFSKKILETEILFSGRLFFSADEKYSMPSKKMKLFKNFTEFKTFI